MAKGSREEKKAELRERLYQTALQLFREQGYAATSVREITQRAGVAKGTFFNHFPTKEHLLLEWYRLCDRLTYAAVKDMVFASARQAIITLMEDDLKRVLADKDLLIAKNQIVYSQHMISDEEQSQDTRFFDFCLHYLREDQQSGQIDPQLDLNYFTNLILTVITGNARRWVYQNGNFNLTASMVMDLNFLFDSIEKER